MSNAADSCQVSISINWKYLLVQIARRTSSSASEKAEDGEGSGKQE